MAKPLRSPFDALAALLVNSMVPVGGYPYRHYPENASDMQACVLALLSKFEFMPRFEPLTLADMTATPASDGPVVPDPPPQPRPQPSDSRVAPTLLAAMRLGLAECRPDLSYPQCQSDMLGCVLAVLARFKVQPRATPFRLEDMAWPQVHDADVADAATHSAAPAAQARPIDTMLNTKWTAATVARTTPHLCVSPSANVDDAAMTHEMARLLRCADPTELAAVLEKLRHTGADASSWDALREGLCHDTLEKTLTCLREHYPDPVEVLCTLLDERVPPEHQWENLDHQCGRAVEVLLTLGTPEALRYLLANIRLVCWNDHAPFTRLVEPKRDELGRAAVEAWDVLSWGDRAMLTLWLAEQHLPTAGLLELLLSVEGETLSFADRIDYVHALSFTENERATLRIHQLLNRELEATHTTDGHKRFVIETMVCLGTELTPEQCQRAENGGIPRKAWELTVH